MSERTLGKARGLNSIADPADFKGTRGRRSRKTEADAPSTPPPPRAEDQRVAADGSTESVATTTVAPAPVSGTASGPVADVVVEDAVVAPHRAVVPGVRRKRRELSVPLPVADAVNQTGINPADVVMSAYRKHSDAIFAGQGGRLVSRGRDRLRLSISDAEFDKITRLGEARGWNRSETVSVLLTMELLQDDEG